MKSYFITFCTICFPIFLQAQFPVSIVRGEEHPIEFIGKDGTTIFQIAGNHKILMQEQFGNRSRSLGYNQKISAWEEGPLVVKRAAADYYLLGKDGHIIKNLGKGKYKNMAPFSEGFAVARVKMKKYTDKKFVYLNEVGEAVLDTIGYQECGQFNEGIAWVRNYEGKSYFIDKTGVQLFENAVWGGYLEKPAIFSDGLARIELDNYDIFIRKDGSVAFDFAAIDNGSKKIRGNKEVKFKNGYAHFKSLDTGDLVFIDKTGKEIFRLNSAQMYHVFTDYAGIKNAEKPMGITIIEGVYQFFYSDGKFKKVRQDANEVKKILSDVKSFDYFFKNQDDSYLRDRLAMSDDNLVKQKIDKSRGVAGRSNGITLLLRSGFDDFELIDDKNQSIYRTPIEKRIFYSVPNDFAEKERITMLSLMFYDNFPETLSELKNLEYLDMENNTAKRLIAPLPESLFNLKKLRYLNIYGINEMIELPRRLTELNNLEYLSLGNLDSYENAEYVIERLPALQKVYTSNYKFSKEFIEKMKTINPNLKFESFSFTNVLQSRN